MSRLRCNVLAVRTHRKHPTGSGHPAVDVYPAGIWMNFTALPPPSTAFRWRHRFLSVPRGVKPTVLAGVVEIDETYVLESFKVQKVVGGAARKRGGSAAARDRSGTTTDYVLTDGPQGRCLLPADAVLCTEGGWLDWARGRSAIIS